MKFRRSLLSFVSSSPPLDAPAQARSSPGDSLIPAPTFPFGVALHGGVPFADKVGLHIEPIEAAHIA
jgi:hypothetical protein